MDNINLLLGILTIIGGLLLTAAFMTVNIQTGTPKRGLLMFGISALLLLSTPIAFLIESVNSQSPAGIGIALTIIGLCVWIIGMLYIRANPTREFRQPFTPLGSFAMSFGMILTGIAILNTDVLDTSWRYVPLLTGLFFLAQFPIQAIFFIRKQGAPSYRVLSIWGVLWAACGVALLTLSPIAAA